MNFLNYTINFFKRLIINLFNLPKNLLKVMCGCFKVVSHYIYRLFCCCFGCFGRKKILTSKDLQGVAVYMKRCKNVIIMTGWSL